MLSISPTPVLGSSPATSGRRAGRPQQQPSQARGGKSCPVVRRKRATTSALSRCIGIGPTVARVSHGFLRLLVFWVTAAHSSMYVDIML
ncbi:hypothetical protein TNCV_2045301 [Trichonephila clavipes]|uniref:Uncharacterized protein n=1 Tax=Trichonephila clavipes TaxID=2585209 RepID=A0A8X6STT9_TRICX|nr:hypothetical protein TNCV_2045301 [Trichonephila clavipes]